MSLLGDLIKNSAGGSTAWLDKNSPVGTHVAGTVTGIAVKQTADPKTKAPQEWPDGNPKQQVVVNLQTAQRDAGIEDDDGSRSVYIKWWGAQRSSFLQAVTAAGVTDLELGDQFAAQFTGYGPQPSDKLMSPAKLITFEIKRGSKVAALVAEAAPTPVVAAAPAATVTPFDASQIPTVKAFANTMDDTALLTMFPGLSAPMLAAIRNMP